MTNMFKPKTPKPDEAMLRAQREQAKAVNDQTAEEAIEAGARRRLQAARAAGGGSSLFSRTGAAGVKETLG